MVRLVVKNAGQTDFPIELPDSATVGDLKAELQKSYPSRPTPAQQKLIFAGRLLNDGSQVISQLITTIKYDVNAPQAVHLVLPPPSLHSSASGLPTSPMVNRIHAQADLRRSAPAGLGAQLPPQHVPHNGQPHPRFVPGNGVAAPFARPQFVPAPAPPAAAPAAAPPLAPAVLAGLGLLGRQNWGLLVKLIVIVYIFSQGGGSWRMTFLWVGAFVVYLYQMGLFPRFNRPAAAAAPAPAPAQPVPPAAAPARADNNAEGEQVPPQADDDNNNDNPAVAAAAPVPATTTAAAPAQQAPARGLWQEVENIFLPFLYSLIPTWQPAAMAQPVPLPGGQPPQVPVHHNHPHHD